MNISTTGYSNYGIPAFNQSAPPSGSPAGDISKPVFDPKVNRPRESATSDNRTDKSSDTTGRQDKSGQRSDRSQINGYQLTQAEMHLLKELQQTDTEVRRHEMAHIAAGGRFITSGANFTYKRGPDGKNYAVGGEVGIDTAPVPGDPQATIQKMRQIKSSALAPANPSAQDLKIAAKAGSMASKALSELMVLTAKEQAQSNETNAFGNIKNAADTYTRVNNLPEQGTGSFDIAV